MVEKSEKIPDICVLTLVHVIPDSKNLLVIEQNKFINYSKASPHFIHV